MDVFECMLNRRSIRRYKEQEVSNEQIEQLLQAAMAAPSACNFQPWEFIVITDQQVLQTLRNNQRLYMGE